MDELRKRSRTKLPHWISLSMAQFKKNAGLGLRAAITNMVGGNISPAPLKIFAYLSCYNRITNKQFLSNKSRINPRIIQIRKKSPCAFSRNSVSEISSHTRIMPKRPRHLRRSLVTRRRAVPEVTTPQGLGCKSWGHSKRRLSNSSNIIPVLGAFPFLF